MSNRKIQLHFGQGDNIFLDYQESVTFYTLIKAMRIINKQGYKKYSTTRLLQTAFKYRSKEFVSENRLRRMIAYLIASKPKYIHIKQKGNLRLVYPSELTISLWNEDKSTIIKNAEESNLIRTLNKNNT